LHLAHHALLYFDASTRALGLEDFGFLARQLAAKSQ
jgi:hypothetical protein